MKNAKKFQLLFFEVFDNEYFEELITDVFVASNLIQRGYSLYAFGNIDNCEKTTRTSKIKQISFSKGKIYIITQNSDYIITEKN